MKKKLEADLISIAHRILKLKNKSELIQLHQETQKLYEKLSVLVFVEENFENTKPTIGLDIIKNKISTIFDDETTVKETENAAVERLASTFIETAKTNKEEHAEVILQEIPENEVVEEIKEEEPKIEEPVEEEVEFEEQTVAEIPSVPSEEKIEEAIVRQIDVAVKPATTIEEIVRQIEPVHEPFFKPAFELSFDAKEEAEPVKVIPVDSQIMFDDFLGPNYIDPVFVTPEEIERETVLKQREIQAKSAINFNTEPKSTSINDQVSKGIAIGLNDRIGFIKHLFGNSSEDYNRVLSQLITFNTIEETQEFIDQMVKPDYNNWDGKEEYSQRFMEIIEKKFS